MSIAPGPTLTTDRLILRPTALEDFEPWAAMMADPENSGFIGGPQPRQLAWRGMMTMAGSWATLGYGMFSLIERDTGRWVGRIGAWTPDGWPGNEVGWAVAREAWGKGYATEAAVASMDWVVDHLGWTDIIHSITPANTASQEVARRLGSVNRGPGALPPPYDDLPMDIWGQTADQWRARRAR